MRWSSGGAAYSGSLYSSYIEYATEATVSRPIRSDSFSGPIGWAQPSSMPLSMSSRLAMPDSNIRIADRR